MNSPSERIVRCREAAKRLGLSTRTVRGMFADGRLPGFLLNQRLWVELAPKTWTTGLLNSGCFRHVGLGFVFDGGLVVEGRV